MNAPRLLRPLVTASLAAAAVLGVTACGPGGSASTPAASTATTARKAAADTVCPEQGGSVASFFTFINDLDTNVTLHVARETWTCAGYSGWASPGTLDGRVLYHHARNGRLHVDSRGSQPDTDFTLAIEAAGTTLATVDVTRFLRPQKIRPGDIYPWGIKADGEYRCWKPLVELKDANGVGVGWLTMTGDRSRGVSDPCFLSADGYPVFQLTKYKPS